jgi:hypothetical protein
LEATLATHKDKCSHKRRKKSDFPEVTAKVVEAVEVRPAEHGYGIGIPFTDRTYLAFDVDSLIRIRPDLSDWKTHNYKPLKRWPSLLSK